MLLALIFVGYLSYLSCVNCGHWEKVVLYWFQIPNPHIFLVLLALRHKQHVF